MERDLSNENMIHVKKDGIEYLQFRKLLEFEDLVNCFTLKTGNLNFRRKTSEELALQSIQKICNVLDVNPNTIVRPNQKHTDCVEKVDSASEDLGTREIDGLITNKKDINLLLTFADCTPSSIVFTLYFFMFKTFFKQSSCLLRIVIITYKLYYHLSSWTHNFSHCILIFVDTSTTHTIKILNKTIKN